MGAGTAGTGDDSVQNQLGLSLSHAYAIIGAYIVTDAYGNEIRLLHC
jgi:hypothetical protein